MVAYMHTQASGARTSHEISRPSTKLWDSHPGTRNVKAQHSRQLHARLPVTLTFDLKAVVHLSSLLELWLCWCELAVFYTTLTNRPTLVHANILCCAVNSCPLANDCDLLAGFSDFYLPLSHPTPSIMRIPSSYRVHIWCGNTRMARLLSGEGRRLSTEVFGHNSSTWQTHTQTDRHVAGANTVLTGCVGRLYRPRRTVRKVSK